MSTTKTNVRRPIFGRPHSGDVEHFLFPQARTPFSFHVLGTATSPPLSS
ncbi:hypothetical protein [Nonomuraea sp. NPDC049400]